MNARNIGKYQIVKVLGQNYSQNRITYLAEANNAQVVLKQFNFNAESNWRQYQNLEKEFQILSKLKNTCVPKFIDYFETPTSYCLVQQHIPALNLNQQQVNQKEVWAIARQVLEVLEYLRVNKIVHKDVKPGNILWDGNKAYLIDFGFSSDLEAFRGASSSFLGTAGFMSPEQLYQGIISHTGDLYSLGITLFCLLLGIEEFELGKYLNEDFSPNIESIECDCFYKEWLAKLTNRQSKERYENAEVALNNLLKRDSSSLVVGKKDRLWVVSGKNREYRYADLRGVNLIGKDFREYDLTGAELAA